MSAADRDRPSSFAFYDDGITPPSGSTPRRPALRRLLRGTVATAIGLTGGCLLAASIAARWGVDMGPMGAFLGAVLLATSAWLAWSRMETTSDSREAQAWLREATGDSEPPPPVGTAERCPDPTPASALLPRLAEERRALLEYQPAGRRFGDNRHWISLKPPGSMSRIFVDETLDGVATQALDWLRQEAERREGERSPA